MEYLGGGGRERAVNYSEILENRRSTQNNIGPRLKKKKINI